MTIDTSNLFYLIKVLSVEKTLKYITVQNWKDVSLFSSEMFGLLNAVFKDVVLFVVFKIYYQKVIKIKWGYRNSFYG